ncbi:hypothetical protein Clacol_003076 [Clathrus columnatus]|uniref:Uncharacterized protein n=1 Tax=Clathrus columnatus TaxID=1419009 RepID=A0AAV5A8G9_9AGAM|nr:hypothetical protein Clacol_003076 [Clathrus columnatus]
MSWSLHGRTPSMNSPLRDKLRISPTLPTPNSMIQEKHSLRNGRLQSWTATYYIQFPPSLPFMRRHNSSLIHNPSPRRRGGLASLFAPRRFKIIVPLPGNIYHSAVIHYGRRRATVGLLAFCLFVLWIFISLLKRGQYSYHGDNMNSDNDESEPPTLVFARQDLQRVWEWEIASGHYPSSRKIPEQMKIAVPPFNPAVPRKQSSPPSSQQSQQRLQQQSINLTKSNSTLTIGSGPRRTYIDIRAAGPGVAYPPRPVPGSVADLDMIMDHCDFSLNKYVRDCLEVLRTGAGLDNSKRMRRGKTDGWQYIYVEEDRRLDQYPPISAPQPKAPYSTRALQDPDVGLTFRAGEVKEPHLRLPPPRTYRPYVESTHPCDPDYPRIFHMFWTGPFTDKPYLAILSFLFTQNLGLHHPPGTESSANTCRPQFWLWINPGPAAAVPNPTAVRDMYDSLSRSPWSSPFLHPRFKDVIKFKLWNTTEQLDGVPEIRDEWRSFSIFNSGGHIIEVPKNKAEEMKGKMDNSAKISDVEEEEASDTQDEILVTYDVDLENMTGGATAIDPSATNQPLDGHEDDIFQRTGTTSSTTYDRLSVILSDLARFILCHRFGGTYLDADTIFLRDWEELWGWKGAFAYRWSRLKKYNTAVLRMNKNSAFGTFLFRTALRNGMDFHPMTISKYVKDAHLDGILLRLPDALFDPAWLNTEDYQRDRPPFPYFTGWRPFDPQRNWPDLGERFIHGEKVARKKLYETKLKSDRGLDSNPSSNPNPNTLGPLTTSTDTPHHRLKDIPEAAYMTDYHVEDDKRDLDWATVLKRTFESYIRGERPNMYGEWIVWT